MKIITDKFRREHLFENKFKNSFNYTCNTLFICWLSKHTNQQQHLCCFLYLIRVVLHVQSPVQPSVRFPPAVASTRRFFQSAASPTTIYNCGSSTGSVMVNVKRMKILINKNDVIVATIFTISLMNTQ